ncbi:MAG: D-alanyl-D-alanine carboxypeptidase [Clostridia bacterium]|nr:D-alanyl-D-alanine carboxypeptidase [Clostridia bacterium]
MEKKRRTWGREDRFLLCMILFMILEILLLVLLLAGPIANLVGSPSTGSRPGEGQTDPETDPEPFDPPILSGGVIPPYPTASDATKQIDLAVASKYAVLVNAETGEILASKQADARFSPASMTKVMTLIVACEQLKESDLERRLVFTQAVVDYCTAGNYAGTTTGLIPSRDQIALYLGDEFRIVDLLYGIGMHSASDCAYMIFMDISGSESAFVALMNQKAQELGLRDTHFDNAVGYESENNYTTASDMAVILSYAIRNELIADILGYTGTYSYKGYYEKDGAEATYNRHFNSSLGERLTSYETTYHTPFTLQTGVLLGAKTGYLEDENGVKNHCLASFCRSKSLDGRYVLILGGGEDYQYRTMKDVKDILDAYLP